MQVSKVSETYTEPKTAPELAVSRLHTSPGQDIWKTTTWKKQDVTIKEPSGEAVFEQPDVEAPEAWSPLAVKVVASKYFRGHIGTESRET